MKKLIFLWLVIAAIFWQSCKEPPSADKSTNRSEVLDSIGKELRKNKMILGRLTEAINSRDLSVLEEFISDDCVNHGFPEDMKTGAAGQRKFISMMLTAFPDLKIEIEGETEIAERKMAFHRVMISGTNKGSLMDMPPTGKIARWSASHLAKVNGGKIVEFWLDADRLGMMRELGVLPSPGKKNNK